ncbi:MAG: esterase-like activity of phytase family protein [Acidobacteriota bacterium]
MRVPRFRLFSALALCASLGCATESIESLDPVDPSSDSATVIRGVPVQLYSDDPERRTVGRLRFRSGLHLTANHEGFGGFSGLVIDGHQLVAVSDRGDWLSAVVASEDDGDVTGLTRAQMGTLCDDDGSPVNAFERRDAEEIQQLPGRGFLVSFERHHRLALFPFLDDSASPLSGRPQPFPFPPVIVSTRPNKGMEAVVLLTDGRLLTFAEELRTVDNDIIGWIGHPELEDWRHLTLVSKEDYLPTGAALLPGGDVLLLERSFRKPIGNWIRLSILPKDDLQPDSRLEPIELAILEPPATTDNMEAVATAPGPGGETFIYLMSDDNFSTQQRTLLMQFELLPAKN